MAHPNRRLALIVGADGQLDRALRASGPSGVICVGRDRRTLDICDSEALGRALEEVAPSVVLNGAAYNLVDRAEGDGMEEALRVNSLGVARLAAACRHAGVPMVHFSTDLVYDGAKRSPYTEDDLPRPLSVYGASKLAGEHLALAADSRNLVVRVCRLFGPAPSERIAHKPAGNFPLLMLHLASQRTSVRVVDDQIGTPSYLPDVACATWQILEAGQAGLFHLSNGGEVTFAEYAREIFRLARVPCMVEGVTSEDYGAAARRPAYSTLSCGKAWAAGVTPLRDWRDALADFLTDGG